MQHQPTSGSCGALRHRFVSLRPPQVNEYQWAISGFMGRTVLLHDPKGSAGCRDFRPTSGQRWLNARTIPSGLPPDIRQTPPRFQNDSIGTSARQPANGGSIPERFRRDSRPTSPVAVVASKRSSGVDVEREFVRAQWGLALQVIGQPFGLTVGTQVHETHRLDRELRAPALVHNRLKRRSHLRGPARRTGRCEIPIPDQAAGCTRDDNRLPIALTIEVLVLTASCARNQRHPLDGRPAGNSTR